MDPEKVRDALVDYGFSEYEADTYVTVLQLGDASMSELADLCDVPRTRTYDIVRKLESRGIVDTYEDDTRRVRVLNPTPLLDRLGDRSERLRTAMSAVETMWERSSIQQSTITVINEYEQALAAATAEFGSAENHVSLAVPAEELDRLRPSLESAIDRGVTVHMSVQDTGGTDSMSLAADDYSPVATEVRRCESITPFFALVDGPTGVFAIEDGLGGEYGVLVRDHFLTSILHWYYQMQLWEPWDVVYSSSSTFLDEYVSIQELIRDLRSAQVLDEAIEVRIEGYETATGQQTEVTGTITDVVRSGNPGSSPQIPFIQATLLVDTGERTLTIGGYGAIIEDIRSYRIRILSID